MPNTKNFAYSTVATAPSPATSGTSLVVASGDGTKFPTAPFRATIWPIGAQPTTANAEVVTVTNVSTDTLTITRAQESSGARTVVVGDQIAATVTAGIFPTGTIVGDTDTQTLTNKTHTSPKIGTSILDSAGNQIAAPSTTGLLLTARTQTDNSNSIASATTNALRLQFGWVQMEGNGTATVTEAVTFPTAFTTVLGVIVSDGGAKTSAAADITALDVVVGAGSSGGWESLTTSGFTLRLRRTSNYSAGSYYAATWMAWGV